MDTKKPKFKTVGGDMSMDISGHINLGLSLFVTTIVLHVINFIYLFKPNTEYLAWIFSVILNLLFPITWIIDVMKYPFGTYKMYMLGCIGVGIILECTALIMTVITNSIIQKRKEEHEDKIRSINHSDPTIQVPNKTVYDKIVNTVSGTIAEIVTMKYWIGSYFGSYGIESKQTDSTGYHVADQIKKNTEINKKLYTTTAVLIIGAITNYFTDQVATEFKKGLPHRSELGNNLYWWLSIIPHKITEFERMWQNAMEYFPVDAFSRFFLLFCGGFSFFLFSFFLRIFPKYTEVDSGKYSKEDTEFLKENDIKGLIFSTHFDIVNFPDIYNQSGGPVNFQGLIAFFFGLLMFLIVPFLATIFNIRSIASFVLLENPSILMIILYIGWLLLFIIPMIAVPPVADGVVTKTGSNLLIAIIGFLFALLGTPVLFMVFEIFSRMGGQPLSRYLKKGWVTPFDEDLLKSVMNNIPFGNGRAIIDPYNWIFMFITFTFFGLWFGIIKYGIQYDWLAEGGNGRTIKFIIIFLISMIVGWLFAFSPYFNVITILINCAIVPVKTVLFFLAPITILALSITQLALADQSSKVIGKVTDG